MTYWCNGGLTQKCCLKAELRRTELIDTLWVSLKRTVMGPLLCSLPARENSTSHYLIKKILLVCSEVPINRNVMRAEVIQEWRHV